MKQEKEFYIGWQEDMPKQTKRFIKKLVIGGILLFIGLVLTVVLFQKPFNQYVFEFGNTKEFTGTYIDNPYPMLISDPGQVPEGFSNTILLVGYGKFGAMGIMNKIQEKQGQLHGKKITLSGTLIYGDKKTLLELTDQQASFISIVNQEISSTLPQLIPNPSIELNGEILDPKCYFGVMKPGEGKIHKSCAIRCISGGIPPVFRQETGDINNPYTYYLLVGTEGKTINQAVLPWVAEQVKIEGNPNTLLDWNIVFVDPNQITRIQ